MGNLVITVPEMPTHCFSLLRASGGIFGREKNIFGFRVIDYIYWAFIRAPGRMQWGGLQWMCLDDDIPIGKVLPFRDVLVVGHGFSLKKTVYWYLASIYTYSSLFQVSG